LDSKKQTCNPTQDQKAKSDIALLAFLGVAMLIRLALWLWLPRLWLQLNGLA
jgi:hypothetical protein